MVIKTRRANSIKAKKTGLFKLAWFGLGFVLARLIRLARQIDERLIWLGKNLYSISKCFDNRLIRLGEIIYFLDVSWHHKLSKISHQIKAIRVFSVKLSLKSLSVVMLLALICTQVIGLQAFEAHIINVTAQIVNDIPGIDPPGGQFCLYDDIEVSLSVSLAGAGIAYTIDGSEPDCDDLGQIYTGPFMVSAGGILQARSCHDGQQSAIISWVFDFAIEYCDDCIIEEGDFCSQTQGGWGTTCSDNNPGCLRDNNWDEVINGNLIVGTGYELTFTGSGAVEDYLPQGETAASLTQSYIDATSTESGVLGGQVTTLKLNVLFSDAGIGLEEPNDSLPLGELIINSGRFMGMNVYDFLGLAEEVLGGDTAGLTAYSASISNVNDTASKINENFVDCAENNNYLTLPYPYCWEVPDDYLKINKVYYDVDSEHGVEGDNEWVEIYNFSNVATDISGWNIKDNIWNDVIPTSDPIPAHGFAIITGQSTTWDYWEIPDEVVKIVLDSNIGNGLHNDSDRVILMTPTQSIMDMMSYGGDTFAFDPSCPDVDEGHMLARVPTGYDTNQASDWQDLAPPSVDLTYPVGGEIWWVGHYYDITWTATNPNGDDSELSIDLYYSADSGSTWANIVQDTANDGVFNWRAPLHINGYYVPSDQARIKVVAIGPENFMVQDWDMSEDFCPPIDYDLLTEEELAYLESMDLYGDTETASTTSDEVGEPVGSSTSDSAPDNTASASSTEDGLAITQEESLASTTDETAAETGTEETSASSTNETAAETGTEETSASSTDETAAETGAEEVSASSTDDIMPDDQAGDEASSTVDPLVGANEEPVDDSTFVPLGGTTADEPEPVDEPEPDPTPADEPDPTPTPADEPQAGTSEPQPEPETNNEPSSE